MAATGNEVPLLSQLKLLKNWIESKLAEKLSSYKSGPINCQWRYIQQDNIFITKLPVCPNDQYVNEELVVPLPIVGSQMANELLNGYGLMSATDKAKLDSLTVPVVDIVSTTTHKTSYTKDTLEVVCDNTGKVTAMYFIKA